MEEKFEELSLILEELDKNSNLCFDKLEILSSNPELIDYIVSNLRSNRYARVLRQLLQYTSQTVLGQLMINFNLPNELIKNIILETIQYDNIWILLELYDESYNDLIDKNLLNKLVNALDGSSEVISEILIKLLVCISTYKLGVILEVENSRFFGEMILYRLNWANGVEKKLFLEVSKQIIEKYPCYFYINDLKMLCDIIISIIENKEEYSLDISYQILYGLLKIKDFFIIKYRFEEILEIVELSDGNEYSSLIKESILLQIDEKE